MSRIRTEHVRARNRSVSYRTEFNQEIEQRMFQLRERIAEVRDLTVDGFPYKDSERVRLELQIRQSIRKAFGDGSPEYQKHQYFRFKPDDVGATIGMLEDLIGRLENQKFEIPDDPRPSLAQSGDAQHEIVEEAPTPASSPAEPPPNGSGRPTSRATASSRTADDTPTKAPPAAGQAVDAPPAQAVPAPGAKGGSGRSAQAQAEPGEGPRSEHMHQRAGQQHPSSNGRVTSKRGESSMIANKSRHEGNETIRETRVEPWTGDGASALVSIRKLCTGFHAVARQLRQRHDDRPTLDVEDEHDVQDLFHALLRLEFQDIRTERWIPGYAGGDERTTFLFPYEGLALVIKRTKPGLGGRELKAQLDIDAQRYSGRPDCQTLLCFVYDPEGRIANPREFEAALTREDEGGTIAVQISP